MAWPVWPALLAVVLGRAQEVPLLCANVTQSGFDPDCLPTEIRDFSDVGEVGKEPPYIYLQWMLAETCGVHLAEFKTQFATLPQVLSRGMKSVFVNFFVYAIGNFLAVGVMSIFYVAPLGRRCWGLFRVGSMGYKRFVGPLYCVMMGLAVWIAVGLAFRFFTELHAFRKLVHEELDTGTWPLQGGGEIYLPHPSVACYYVFELRWMTYRHCFDILVLMTFTSVDLLVCILEPPGVLQAFDLTWLPVGPTSSWEYHWVVLKAIFIGITDGFHGIFVDVPVAVVTEPKATFRHLWNIADTGIDVVNLFKADRRQSPTEPMDDGQFKGNFDDFEATVLLLRLILTVLFGCLRLTAMIARTPDKPSDESDGDEEEDSEDGRLLHRPHAVHAIAGAKPATVGAAFAQSERWPLATALCSVPAGFTLRRSQKRRRPCLAINNEEDIYMDDFVSPGQMLRCRRSEQRNRLLPVLSGGWSRTDGLPRGQDAGFQFQNVGPLVGCTPSLWIYFVGSSAVPSRCPWQVQEVMLLFEQVCDSTQSYSLLTSASGCIASEHWRQDSEPDKDVPTGGPTDRLQQPASECSALSVQEVLGRYDLVVAMDEGTRARVAALAGGNDERLCCLADFLDVCPVQDQISQLQLLWDRKGLACTVRPDARSVGRARSLTDLDDVDSSDLLLVAQALAVAGLERFLISQFPQGLKDRLHPHLVPKGI
ncbi:KEA2 [Symbiodinium sp. CCMP2456]|nr:KEA2 [Symbiodinium sp. CCMP2456]